MYQQDIRLPFKKSAMSWVATYPSAIYTRRVASKGWETVHTTYSWNIICQKCECDCGLWVFNEIINKKYAESLKKIMGAVWELPAK